MFDKKNDPLLEAAAEALERGKLRAEVETLVNEAFGIYSKKALPNEYHKEYDRVLEEAYQEALEEGIKRQKLVSKILNKSIKDSNKEFYKMAAGGPVAALRASNNKVARARALDNISDPNPDNWEHRGRKFWLKKAKQYGDRQRKWAARDVNEEEQLDELSSKTLGKYFVGASNSKAHHTKRSEQYSKSADRVYDKHDKTKEGPKQDALFDIANRLGARSFEHDDIARKRSKGISRATERLVGHKYHVKGEKKARKYKLKESEELNELNKSTLQSYVGKAKVDKENATRNRIKSEKELESVRELGKLDDKNLKWWSVLDSAIKSNDRARKREKGISKATSKLRLKEEVEPLDELNKRTLQSYISKASNDAHKSLKRASRLYKPGTKRASRRALKRAEKRERFIKLADDKVEKKNRDDAASRHNLIKRLAPPSED